MSTLKTILVLLFFTLFVTSCKVPEKFGDARKNPPNPEERIKKNLEEGKGFRIFDTNMNNVGGNFEFASSNELWRASLDIIDFIPLASVNYSGGIIITDWYSSEQNNNDQLKISIRFLTNEIRSDALDIKIFTKECDNKNRCKIFQKNENLISELKKEILRKAVIYEKENSEKDNISKKK